MSVPSCVGLRTSIRPTTKSFLRFERNLVCRYRGRCDVMHEYMPYNPIQGQDNGSLKCAKIADFKGYLLRQYACNQRTNSEL